MRTDTLAELQRDMARLGFVVSQIREIEQARQKRLEQETETGPHAMVRQVARVIGIGILFRVDPQQSWVVKHLRRTSRKGM
jgi:hypothetical protein